MRIFVTGATGFIGRHLLPLLGGHQVLALSRNPAVDVSGCNWIRGDLRTPEQWQAQLLDFQPESCLHLAWEGIPDYSQAQCRANLACTLNLFSLLDDCDCGKTIGLGSCWEYGECSGPVSERHCPERRSVFAAFKAAIAELGAAQLGQGGRLFQWARVFFVYGPGQRSGALIPSCHQALRSGRQPELRAPQVRNDFVYVGDVAAALATLVTRVDVGGIFNIGSGRPTRVGDVAREVARCLNQSLPDDSATTTGPGWWADISRLSAAAEWRPVTTLEAGIRMTVAWLEDAAATNDNAGTGEEV